MVRFIVRCDPTTRVHRRAQLLEKWNPPGRLVPEASDMTLSLAGLGRRRQERNTQQLCMDCYLPVQSAVDQGAGVREESGKTQVRAGGEVALTLIPTRVPRRVDCGETEKGVPVHRAPCCGVCGVCVCKCGLRMCVWTMMCMNRHPLDPRSRVTVDVGGLFYKRPGPSRDSSPSSE